jgi:hypothetical protein
MSRITRTTKPKRPRSEAARYRNRLIAGFLLEQHGIKADAITPEQLFAAERRADSVLGKATAAPH